MIEGGRYLEVPLKNTIDFEQPGIRLVVVQI
jgi:hypothetical protein